MPDEMDTFEIEPTGTALASVIWLHGLGAGPHDFESVVPLLNAKHHRFVFPAAPIRPVTINGGLAMPAWYDILSLSDPPLREHEPDVRSSEQLLRQLIEREHRRGVPYSRIVLIGFSQGGAMALHTGLRFEQTLGGIVVLSGYLLLPHLLRGEQHASNQHTPMLLCHGTQDPMVPLALAKASHGQVVAAGHQATFKTYPMAHSLCLEEVHDLRDFLQQVTAEQARP